MWVWHVNQEWNSKVSGGQTIRERRACDWLPRVPSLLRRESARVLLLRRYQQRHLVLQALCPPTAAEWLTSPSQMIAAIRRTSGFPSSSASSKFRPCIVDTHVFVRMLARITAAAHRITNAHSHLYTHSRNYMSTHTSWHLSHTYTSGKYIAIDMLSNVTQHIKFLTQHIIVSQSLDNIWKNLDNIWHVFDNIDMLCNYYTTYT